MTTHDLNKPVAYLTQRMSNSFAAPGYETCEPTDYGAFPVYRAAPPAQQAQAEAVPNRAFLERTLAAMEGVIDVADRKTDEFDAMRSCIVDLTLMLYANKANKKGGAT